MGPAGRIATPVRPRHRQADRRRASRSELRRAHRRPRADAAQHLRRRFGHVAQGHWRRAAHPAGRRARNHRRHAGLGVRADNPAPGPTGGPGRGGRQRRLRTAPGDDPGSPAGQDGHRLRRLVMSIHRSSNSANGSCREGIRSSSASRRSTTNPDVFPDPQRFDPQRYIGSKPSTFAWMPFGGGARRCVGAAFANMEMDVVLRTVLRHFTIETTTAPGERWHCRGVAYTPKDGGRMVVHRR